MIYHLYYDVKIWSNGGPLIEGMDNEEKVSDDIIDEEQEKQNDEDGVFRETVKRAAKAAAEAARGEAGGGEGTPGARGDRRAAARGV